MAFKKNSPGCTAASGCGCIRKFIEIWQGQNEMGPGGMFTDISAVRLRSCADYSTVQNLGSSTLPIQDHGIKGIGKDYSDDDFYYILTAHTKLFGATAGLKRETKLYHWQISTGVATLVGTDNPGDATGGQKFSQFSVAPDGSAGLIAWRFPGAELWSVDLSSGAKSLISNPSTPAAGYEFLGMTYNENSEAILLWIKAVPFGSLYMIITDATGSIIATINSLPTGSDVVGTSLWASCCFIGERFFAINTVNLRTLYEIDIPNQTATLLGQESAAVIPFTNHNVWALIATGMCAP